MKKSRVFGIRSLARRVMIWIAWAISPIASCCRKRRIIKRVGIYGGKFDPIHDGHLICAEWTREVYNLDLVLFVVSANPPHKKVGVLDAELRLEMVAAATADNPYFEPCRLEIDREGPSFTIDTIKAVRKLYGDDVEISLMLSAEYLDPTHPWHLPKWKGAEEIFKLVRVLVFPRDTKGQEQAQEWAKLIPQARIETLACPSPPISSSMLRERASKGLSLRYTTPYVVQQIITKRGHYLESAK